MSRTPDALPGLRESAVSGWLAATSGMRPPVRYRRLGNGQSNLTYLATDADGRRLVLRRPPLGTLLRTAHDVAREHRILRSLAPTAVPSPSVIAFTEDPGVTDVPLLAVAHVDGLVVDELAIAERLSPATRNRIGLALTATLGAVHATDLDETGLRSLASHNTFAERQLRRWRRQWESSRTPQLPQVDDLAGRLAAAVPAQGETTLVHGDYHLLNVILAEDGSTVRAVLDWELATLGDPLADLGALLAYWPQPEDHGAAVFSAPTLPGFPSRAQLVDSYVARTGRDVSALPFWHALALWKLAIIAEGVLRRSREEPRNAPRRSLAARLPQDLAERSQRVARAAGF